MSSAQLSANDVDVDLGRLFASLVRNWLRILLWAVALTGIAFVLAMLATPKYSGETRLLIETRESVFTQPDTRNQPLENPLLDEEGVASQVEIIGSTEILKQVATKLELAKLPEFDEAADLSAIDHLLVIGGLKTDPDDIPVEERVLKRMREKLDVYRVERSRVIVIEFSSEDPKLAAAIPNAIADEYLQVSTAAKLDSNASATGWLQPEIADLTKRVKEAEAKVAAFRANSDLLIGQNDSVLATQQLSELSTELSRVRANRATAEATADGVRAALRNGASLDALPKVLESPLIQRLREREVQLKADIADLSTTLLDNHPRIRSLRSQLTDLEGQIRGEAQNVLRSLSTEAETARARESQLVSDLNRLKAESARAGEDEVELRALEREAAAQRELLNSYLTRYREASSRSDRNYLPADARIFSRAMVPAEPYFPKVLPIVGAALVGSLLIMSIITLLQELFSGRAMQPAPGAPAERAGLPHRQAAAASVGQPRRPEAMVEPAAKFATAVRLDPLVSSQPAQKPVDVKPPAETVASPVVSIGQIDVDQAVEKIIATGVSRVIFVSPEGEAGAASSVLAAREIADTGLRVMLMDLTEGGAASRTMLESIYFSGITNLLSAEAQFADVIHSDHYSEAHIIPVGTADPFRAMRAAERLPIILDSLSTVYEVIVIEAGPTDAASLARLVGDNGAIMVSVLDPLDKAIADSMADLERAGYVGVTLVSPQSGRAPTTPAPGLSAA
ncbi:MAG: GumC family protein [Rhizobiaceae bacterium]